ncbi:hypothetical protein GJ688_11835 [Heliobacillus mobilis]|uniref:Uncharacterized protein n=1 Tax=Heliobacterium mobile TaxID=28064 RepID=A0A6I3SLN3_HELMO|nr:hypothetical protein [Heliobacterium mobile]MTV49665.1 hypothetical protein [Heliobacterium mobile]
MAKGCSRLHVLFANAPRHYRGEEGKACRRGVRAGSRWPHTSPFLVATSCGYIPFPFFLATATALARDSIAEGERYEDFFAYVASPRPDVSQKRLHPAYPTIWKVAERCQMVVFYFTGIHFELEMSFLHSLPVLDFAIFGDYGAPVVELLKVLAGLPAGSRGGNGNNA